MNDYERKQEERRERYLDRASDADRESRAGFERARVIADMIPLGQPVLVGHHSEKRHRRDLDRIDRGMRAGIDAQEKADYYRNKAESVGKGGVSSDDPDAVEKLREKVAKLEADQQRMIAANRIVRKYKTFCSDALAALINLDMGFTQATAEELFKPDFRGRLGFPAYATQNNNANIRRIKERIEQLTKDAGRETKETEVAGVRVVQNAEANRVQVIFPGKPDEAVRTELKGRGFRWSPMESAWQRHLNNGGIYATESFVKWYQEQKGAASA